MREILIGVNLCCVTFILVVLNSSNKESCEDISSANVVTVVSNYKIDGNVKSTKLRNVTITAYTNRVEETDDTPNVTCTGRSVRDGMVAVSRDLWNKVIFPGDVICVDNMDRCFVADDTMNKRFKKRMDVFMYDVNVAKKFKVVSDVRIFHVK